MVSIVDLDYITDMNFCQEVMKELREEYPHIRRVYVRMYYRENYDIVKNRYSYVLYDIVKEKRPFVHERA